MTYKKTGIWAAVLGTIFGLAALIGSLTYGLIYINNDRKQNLVKLETSYQNSFYELSESVSSIESNLCKMMVSVSDRESAVLAAENHRYAIEALKAISSLPIDRSATRKTAKFLNQVGDWNFSIGKAVAAGKDITSYRDKIEEIYIHIAQLNSRISDMVAEIKEDHLVINNLNERVFADFDYDEESVDPSAEYPELIYDGPYSDAAEKDSFGELEELPVKSEREAVEVLIGLFDGISDIKPCGRGGKPESYMFTATLDGSNAFAAVSVKGGKLITINTDKRVTVACYGEEFLIRKAKDIAASLGYRDLTAVWFNETDGVAVVNLVPETDGVICYTDLVKVKVGMDGSFIGFEATGYCKCHRDRSFAHSMNEAAAASCVSSKLNIDSVRLALVPDNGTERLCYEVSATFKGLRYFVYVDANDGDEVAIMRVVDQGGQGRMVM